YRFEGIQGNCFDCQYKGNDWPFLGTEGYSYIKKERIRYIACKLMNTLSNENRLPLCAEIIEFLISSPPFLFL
ncbi:MAG: hypothetical protein PHF76_10875, partial [Bacteroidales bacterium]|nr:hypothetical protein [Bacteroidales bacterium]